MFPTVWSSDRVSSLTMSGVALIAPAAPTRDLLAARTVLEQELPVLGIDLDVVAGFSSPCRIRLGQLVLDLAPHGRAAASGRTRSR
ncbi:hypothetical protein [Microbacterium aurum]